MKVVLLLLLFCVAEAEVDVRSEIDARFAELKSQLEGHNADIASRLSATEAKMEELQKLVQELQKNKADMQLHTDCQRRKLCEQDGFTLRDGLCYYFSNKEQKNWMESRQWCRDRNSDLIVIKSKEKQDFVASFNKRIWIGLREGETEGSMEWVDGTPLTTPTYWFPDQTSYGADVDCVEYYDGSVPFLREKGWFKNRCVGVLERWMCERVLC